MICIAKFLNEFWQLLVNWQIMMRLRQRMNTVQKNGELIALSVVRHAFLDADVLPEDVAPVAHAYWIGVEGDGYAEDENGEMQIIYDVFECSNCGCEHHADGEPRWAYCPNCGARMDGE